MIWLLLYIAGCWVSACTTGANTAQLVPFLVWRPAGRRLQRSPMSLVALAFGASSVFGLAGYADQYNLNALWWTLSGALFLVVLAYTFRHGNGLRRVTPSATSSPACLATISACWSAPCCSWPG